MLIIASFNQSNVYDILWLARAQMPVKHWQYMLLPWNFCVKDAIKVYDAKTILRLKFLMPQSWMGMEYNLKLW